MSDAEHAKRIRNAYSELCQSIDNARKHGLNIDVVLDINDTMVDGNIRCLPDLRIKVSRSL